MHTFWLSMSVLGPKRTYCAPHQLSAFRRRTDARVLRRRTSALRSAVRERRWGI